MSSPVRVRFAPSPTGYLHVGGARTALYNYLFAKNKGGEFIIRIEDTDLARSTDESLQMVLEDLSWLKLNWSEGPDEKKTTNDMGPLGPYRQSQRLDIYKKVADELIQKEKAYYCFMTDEEITLQRDKLKAQGKIPHVESPYEKMPPSEALAKVNAGEKAVVRFKTRQLKKDYIFTDLIRGEVKFPSDMVGDFVLLRTGGMPVYNFCCAVDDHLMKMTHVLRAEEHLPNTLRQLMIYEAMGWQAPQFGHLSLILDEDRQKLSKRKGATSCHEFKLEGYLPAALLNFVALLGWSAADGKEIMTIEEMTERFDLSRAHQAGAVFDAVKLKWMNAQHLRALPHGDLWRELQPFFKSEELEFHDVSDKWIDKSAAALKTSFETLLEGAAVYKTLSDKHFLIAPEADEILAWPSTKAVVEKWKNLVTEHSGEEMSETDFAGMQKAIQESCKVKGKELFQALRVAIIGKPHGTELKILVPLMTKKSLIYRAEKVLAK